ncbi:hypothetical protein PAMA_006664 [Pampus argenteus]
MAISKNGLTIVALLVTLYILETGDSTEFSSLVSAVRPCVYDPEHQIQVHSEEEEEHFLPHSREKRDVLTDQWNYIVDVVSDVETFEQIQSFLNTTSLPIQLDNMTEISSISLTMVCTPTGAGFQCRCEELFAWPYSSCVKYGACDNISGGICKCINAIPADGQTCQPISALLGHSEYEVDVELNVTDIATLDYLRSLLTNGSFSLTLGPTVNVTHINITTVCYPNGTSFQCRCEDHFVWSHEACITYGACDDITDDMTCRCINAIPSNGQYCQPKTAVIQLYEYLLEVELRVGDVALIEQLRNTVDNINFPIRLNNTINITKIDVIFTVPPVIYEYQISIEVNTADVDKLRNTLGNITFPIQISTQINISNANITTVCSQDDTGFQCRCEDDYLWPCDKCVTYGKCEGDTNSICGCIKAIPADGQYCQSVQHQTPPVVYEYLISVELNTEDVTLIEQLRTILRNISFPISINNHLQININDINISTVCYPSSAGFQCRCEDQYRWSCDQCFLYGSCDNITNDTCGCINALPPNGQYCQLIDQHTPPVVYEYLISIELNTTDVTVIDQLRNINYPINISSDIQISAVNISTVCYPSTAGFQCRCEDQYRWSCDQCFLYGSCDNITNDTCGCINALPPNGQYCQIVDQHNFTACPVTTPSPSPTTPPVVYEFLISIELIISDAAVINQLRTMLSNISYPISINSHIQINDINISTVCYPSSAGFQCRCEDQYRWSCDQCFLYGFCDNITNDTCGCINALPPNGQYCQIVDQHNSTTVGTTGMGTTRVTTTPTTVITTIVTPDDISTTAETPTSTLTRFDVDMLMRLDKEYTPELNNATSSTYKELESRISSVLVEQYKGITGFINVFVKGFREGSIITDFVVQTRQVEPDEIADANKKLPEAMKPIALVIGSVSAFYNSLSSISFPDLTYTNDDMTLTCGPPANINVGQISGSEWKFKERIIKDSGRIKITTSNMMSKLRIAQVVPADAGNYECTLEGRVMNFLQKGFVTSNNIKQAPILRLPSMVNVQCQLGQIQPLKCCVQSNYKVKWFQGTTVLQSEVVNEPGNTYCITHNYNIESCSGSQQEEQSFICRVDEPKRYEMTTTVIIFREDVKCDDTQYGKGREGDRSSIACNKGQEGSKTAVCKDGKWTLEVDSCIVTQIKELLIDSQDLAVEEVPQFVTNLSTIVQSEKTDITNSSPTISAIVNILNTVAQVSTAVVQSVMKNVLETVDVIIGDDARESWEVLNTNETNNASSQLLGSMETLSEGLIGEFAIVTQRIQLNKTTFNNSFGANLNSSVSIDIPNTNNDNVSITTITFATLNNVMPARNSSFNSSIFNATDNQLVSADTINAAVVLVKTDAFIQNVTLSFDKRNNFLKLNPQCVFWNFTQLDNLGAWDNQGCIFDSDINNTVTCRCNHLTSFSILMAIDIPASLRNDLAIITYFGVGISLASLVICLIIEGYVWKAITRNSTAFMRHVSIVNTALSLLIADICFLIGASIVDDTNGFKVPVGPCSTATFFMHFFYLALFFWMLVSGLLLFYRTVMVFSHMSKSTMLAIGFSLGYGCPLIIAVITVAVTAPQNNNNYIRKTNACWLNWKETMALLALVIPALTIVFINILIVIVVLFKMLRRGVGDAAQPEEKHTMVVITRCLIILTPLFGLTWSLGVGTMFSTSSGIHIAFAFFNSLQGFFILVFGTLFDSKVS